MLRASGVPVIELRASIVIGSGSLSFEMIRALVDKNLLRAFRGDPLTQDPPSDVRVCTAGCHSEQPLKGVPGEWQLFRVLSDDEWPTV